ncbi:MAG: hypothetical protein DMG07_19580, partial [Acidobacteria bacterium]
DCCRTAITDISALVAAEQEVRRLNAGLEERVAQRTAELEAANRRLRDYAEALETAKREVEQASASADEADRVKLELERTARAEAEKANRVKDDFLAVLSHELRTPLNAMLGWTQVLRSGRLGAAERERALEAIERNIRAQAQLIGDLLDVSRILSGKLSMDLRTTEIEPVIEAAIDSVRPAAEAKGVRLECALSRSAAPLRADPGRLQQVVWNLLTNGIKFTPAGGSVRIESRDSDGSVEIRVSDTGAGISAEFLPHIFDRFQQADSSTTRSQGGLGLGLSIVRHLAEAHGGTVRAESPGPGKGATFTVRLPIERVAAIRGEPGQRRRWTDSAGAHALEGVRVLVVEDDPDSQELVAKQLELLGAVVRTADSAREAMRQIESFCPDVLVSDIAMPEEDGYELMRQVRSLADEHSRSTPALALSAFARSEDRDRALATGFQAHLGKPVEFGRLASAVHDLASARRQRAPAAEGEPEPPASPAGPLRILVVDDDPGSAEYLATILRLQGHEVLTATDATSAFEAASFFQPEVVLMDVVLREGPDGNEVAARMRQQPGLEETRFVAVTGYSRDSARLAPGVFDSCLTKPVEPEALVKLLRSHSSFTRASEP